MAAADTRLTNGVARIVLRVAILIAVVVAANFVSAWLIGRLTAELTAGDALLLRRLVMFSVFAYALLIAIPFVPGIEIGIALLVVVGKGIALPVYGATVLGLFLSFLIGRSVPQAWLASTLLRLRLARASRWIGEIQRSGVDEGIADLMSHSPSRLLALVLRHRYLALAVALNIPGNVVIGGGGGISMMAGLSRLYAAPLFLLTLALAVAPVPLAVLLFGREILL